MKHPKAAAQAGGDGEGVEGLRRDLIDAALHIIGTRCLAAHSLHRAVIDAGPVRLRPVLVTVVATVGGLVPLAIVGGPMWRQLVHVQIGGLLLATVVTKGVVPLLHVLFAEDLKLIDWRPDRERLGAGVAPALTPQDDAPRR